MPTKRPPQKRTLTDRVDRLENAVERLADETRVAIRDFAEETRSAIREMREENQHFQRAVRGAIESLAESASKHDKAIANLEKQWQAYLRTLHPRQ